MMIVMDCLTLVSLLVLAFGVELITSAGVVRVHPQPHNSYDSAVDNSTLQFLLCDTSGNLNDTVFVLSTAGIHRITTGALCLVQHVHNLTIMATPHSNKSAIIQCTVNQNNTQQKLTIFASTEIKFSNVAFTDCGDMFINTGLAVDQSSGIQLQNVSKLHMQGLSIGLSNCLALSLKACFCNPDWTPNNSLPLCQTDTLNFAGYPGSNISVNVIVIDAVSNTPVFSGIDLTSTFFSLYAALGRQCTPLSMTLLSNTTDDTLIIKISVTDQAPSAYVNVTVKNCPLGFQFSPSQKICTCPLLIQNNGLTCNVADGTVNTPAERQVWLGLLDREIFYGDLCPLGYCTSPPSIRVNVTELCANNRTGVLCGRCADGLSSTFGVDTICQECSNLWLLTIPVFLLTGIALVVVLFALRLTISKGTINGIIFYANLFAAVDLTSFNRLPLLIKPLYITMNFLSLSLGFPLCFYAGMDELAKAFLNFLFPSYLFFIAGVIIFVSRFSIKLSNLTAHSSVQVLATLVFLSYASLLGAVFKIFDANVIMNLNETIHVVWFNDGNVPYFQNPSHIALCLIALLFYLGLILPYTVLITVGSYLYKFKIINKFKAFLDAHYGPYKDEYRFWFGIRLCLIQLIFLFNATVRFKFYILLTIIQVVLSIFLVVEALLKPYKKNWLNWFDSVLILVYILIIAISNVLSILIPTSLVFQNVVIVCVTITPLLGTSGVLCYHLKLVCCPKYKLLKFLKKRQSNSALYDSPTFQSDYVVIDQASPQSRKENDFRESVLDIID